MIINGVQQKDVTISGSNNVQDMSMKIDEKAFSILIDKLYSRKKEAIVRELCSNASDAHVDAGIPHIQYDLILPSLSSTELVVRDYGYGLSKQDVQYYLGTLFGSKSSDSNDAIGGFGLGAKSPFCLVDSYHITSYHEGLKHSFFYVREAGGIPKFVHLSSSKSDEKSGIKFTVNVGEENMRGWAETTESVLSMFPVKPNCNIELNYAETDVLFDTIEVIKGHTLHSSICDLACMGGVIYPVDKSLNDIVGLDTFYRRISYGDRNIILRFEIGELDVAPSREALEYTTRTITAINKKIAVLNDSVDYISNKVSSEINSKLGVIPYSDIFNKPPISLFHVTRDYNMFTDAELNEYTRITSIYNTERDLKFEYITTVDRFRHLIKTCGNSGLSSSTNIIINNTSHSYKLVSEQIPNANTVRIPKNVDEKTALFFLTRVCDYKYGAGNFTIEYFKDLYKKPVTEVERKSSVGYIIGARNVYSDKVLKVNVDFEKDFIVYAIKGDYIDKDGIRYGPGEINTLLRESTAHVGDGKIVRKLIVTESTEKRLKLDTADNAINIFDYLSVMTADAEMVTDIAKHLAWSKHNRGNSHNIDYKYGQSTRSIIARKGISKLVTDQSVDIFKRALITAKTHLIHEKFREEDIVPLHYIEHAGALYGQQADVVDLILADVVVKKSTIINNLKATINKCTLQEVIELLY